MRIANNIINIAVVTLAAYVVGWQRGTRSTNSSEYFDWSSEGEVLSSETGSRMITHKEFQSVHRREGVMSVDCCPSTMEMTEPDGGRNQNGIMVDLFKEGNNVQRFYELSCRKGVVGKPCRFVDNKQYQSRCVQKYSYSYAIIKKREDDKHHHHHHNQQYNMPFPAAGTNWTLGYIQVRSGCSCVVTPTTKRRRSSNKGNKHKGKRGKSRRESEESPPSKNEDVQN